MSVIVHAIVENVQGLLKSVEKEEKKWRDKEKKKGKRIKKNPNKKIKISPQDSVKCPSTYNL